MQRYYLKYAAYITRVLYDYNNLRYFITTKSLSTCQAQYAKKLAKFNFKIKYKLGKANPANTLSRRPNYAKGFKDSSKRTVLNAILPILQQKLRVISLVGGPSATIPNQRVAYIQYISDPCEYGAGGLGCPTILFKTSLTGLIAFNLREDPLAQAMVPYNNPASYLRIIYYFTSTNFI